MRAAERKPCHGMVSLQFPFPAQGEIHGNLWQFIRFIPSDRNQNHPPIVARQVATKVFNIHMEKFQDPDDDHPYTIQYVLCKVFNLAGFEMTSVHLPPNTLCVRFKEIVCRHLTMTTQQKDCCRFVCQNGKMMPGNNATLRSWCPEIWVFNPRKAPCP